MATMAPSMPEVISLMRSLLRTAAKFPDYNIREYTRRRVIDAFRENRALADASSISSAFAEGSPSSRSPRGKPWFTPSTPPKSRALWRLRASDGFRVADSQ
ncbi:Complex 1 LYR protein [Dioscorea alata]|uniref:Complex 1 LYR protein n=1 Tax=Dioscorea alata TaxID=55571 RepID=A0ACB7VH72_DIOAL|nr:Complex 1 LYR protein [Dioscorea alata]